MIILKGISGAVSLPSAAFRAADLLATRLGITRRELDATAVADFVERWARLEVEQRDTDHTGNAGMRTDRSAAR